MNWIIWYQYQWYDLISAKWLTMDMILKEEDDDADNDGDYGHESWVILINDDIMIFRYLEI